MFLDSRIPMMAKANTLQGLGQSISRGVQVGGNIANQRENNRLRELALENQNQQRGRGLDLQEKSVGLQRDRFDRQAQSLDLQDEMREKQILQQNLKNLDSRQQQRIKSTVLGAGELQAYLDADDIEGATKYLQNRRTDLGKLIADGYDVDIADTDEALALMQQSPDQLKKNVAGMVEFGKKAGILKSDITSSLGGGTGVLVSRLMQEDPNLTMRDALFMVQAGNRQGLGSRGGNIESLPGYNQAIGVQEAAKDAAKKNVEKQFDLPRAQATMNQQVTQFDNVVAKIDDILPRINNTTAGFLGKAASLIPGSPAFNLKADIDTVLANAGFAELQKMRDNSPTGGALGQVAVRELELLQSMKQNLINSQSPGQLKKNAIAFKNQMIRAKQAAREDFERQFKDQLPDQQQESGDSEEEIIDFNNI